MGNVASDWLQKVARDNTNTGRTLGGRGGQVDDYVNRATNRMTPAQTAPAAPVQTAQAPANEYKGFFGSRVPAMYNTAAYAAKAANPLMAGTDAAADYVRGMFK